MQTIISAKPPSPANHYKKAKGKNKFNVLTAYCSKREKLSDTNALQQSMFTSLKKY